VLSVQTLGGDVQTFENEANADVADTLIDDALGQQSFFCIPNNCHAVQCV